MGEITPKHSEAKSVKQANVLKIIVAGEGAVGKTSLIRRYVYNDFIDTKMTIGVAFASKVITIGNQPIKLSIWDFAGETNFRFVLQRFCFGAAGALLVFDLTRVGSFYTLPEWVEIVRRGAGEIPIILVGNKSDLAHQANLSFTKPEIKIFIRKFGLKSYIETSARDGSNVDQVFQTLLTCMRESQKLSIRSKSKLGTYERKI